MAKKPTGGPAYPVIAENGLGHVSNGMTQRAYFAVGALHAAVVRHPDEDAKFIAGYAVELADELLAALDG